MPIGNIVTSRLKDAAGQQMGSFAPTVMPALNQPLNGVSGFINSGLGGIQGFGGGNGVVSLGSAIKSNNTAGGIQRSGLTYADGDELPSSYKIIIYSSGLKAAVIAPIQDKTTFRVTGEWEPFIPNVVQGVWNQASQLLFKQALVSRYTSRRIWKGTSPIEITLNLPFNSVNDTFNNVIEPVLRLVQMAAPSEEGALAKFLPLLTPPGPSPFNTEELALVNNAAQAGNSAAQAIRGMLPQATGAVNAVSNSAQGAKKWLDNGDNISIRIGDYLIFNKVVVKDVQPTFDTAHDTNGWPIRATVMITFQTYEMPTKETLRDSVFRLKK